MKNQLHQGKTSFSDSSGVEADYVDFNFTGVVEFKIIKIILKRC